jgi:outer membrane protein assembly factor BamD (BamD/ComL family)
MAAEASPHGSAAGATSAPAGGHPRNEGKSGALAEEQRVIETIHTALGRGDPAAALAAADDHARRFASGAYAEEREALAVQALARAGRTNEARARGERFRARYPRSLFLPNVETAIGVPR